MSQMVTRHSCGGAPSCCRRKRDEFQSRHQEAGMTLPPFEIKERYSIGRLEYPAEDDEQFKELPDAEQTAIEASVDDAVWAVWENESGELMMIAYQQTTSHHTPRRSSPRPGGPPSARRPPTSRSVIGCGSICRRSSPHLDPAATASDWSRSSRGWAGHRGRSPTSQA